MPGQYLLDNADAAARTRHMALEALLNPGTFRRLAATGIGPGARCLEVGTGAASVARWLSDRVGPAGHVLAIDLDLRWADAGGHANLELCQLDVASAPLAEAAFDLIFARCVLLHIPQREAVLDKLVGALRPGGVLLIEEFDRLLPHVPDPEAPYAELTNRVQGAFLRFLENGGADMGFGRTVPRLMSARGLVEVGCEGEWAFYRGGSVGSRLQVANTRQGRDGMVAAGLATDADVEAFLLALDDPALLASSSLLFASWGRLPAV